MVEKVLLFVSKNAPSTGDNNTAVIFQGGQYSQKRELTLEMLEFKDPDGIRRTVGELKEEE